MSSIFFFLFTIRKNTHYKCRHSQSDRLRVKKAEAFFFYYHSNEIVPGDLVERAGTISESEETNVRTKQEKLNGRIEGEGQGECNTTTCGGALTFPPSHTLRTSC